jgi:hypothetical protein
MSNIQAWTLRDEKAVLIWADGRYPHSGDRARTHQRASLSQSKRPETSTARYRENSKATRIEGEKQETLRADRLLRQLGRGMHQARRRKLYA